MTRSKNFGGGLTGEVDIKWQSASPANKEIMISSQKGNVNMTETLSEIKLT